MKVVMTFSDGRTATWDDGRVEGSASLLERLDARTERIYATVEGPSYPPSAWRTDVHAFIGAITELPRPETVTLEMAAEGVPPLSRPVGAA